MFDRFLRHRFSRNVNRYSVSHFILAGLVTMWAVSSATPLAADEWQADEDGHRRIIAPFMRKFCLSCHGPKEQEGEFRVDQDLKNDFLDRVANEKWGEVVNMLNSHEMPPEGETQPSSIQVGRVVDWITAQMAKAEIIRRDASIVLRRMNRAEYRNTIRDLIGIDFDPSSFPQDPPAGGFDNNGGALTISPLHLELYYNAARQILDRALVEGDQPPVLKWRFEPESGDSDRNRVTYDGQRIIINGGRNPVEGPGRLLRIQQWDRNINCRDFALPYEGEYIIRVHAGGRVPTRNDVVASATNFLEYRLNQRNKENPKGAPYHKREYDRNLKHFQTDRMYDYGSPRLKLIKNVGGQPSVVGEFDVDAPFSKPNTYTFATRFKPVRSGIVVQSAYSIPGELENWSIRRHDDFPRPEAIVDWIEIEGPIYDSWPPQSHRAILFNSKRSGSERDYARQVVARFMRRAYRRPVSDDEIDSKMSLYDQVRDDAPSFIEAIKTPLSAVLISPHFLFLVEPSIERQVAQRVDTNGWLVDFEQIAKGPTPSFFLIFDEPSKLPSPFRMFRDTRGRVLRGRILAIKGTKVTFQSSDKKTSTIRLSVFSPKDRTYIRSLVRSSSPDTPRPAASNAKQSTAAKTKMPTTTKPESRPSALPATNPGDDSNSTNAALRRLNPYEIASRLSYLLWSSMPDDGLFAAAESGKLAETREIERQIDRMLGDPRSYSFVQNFAGQWLGLREVGANPPAQDLFPRYDRHLEISIVQESEQFFAEILNNDLSVMNFVKSDFVVVNERLARFYSIPNVKGDYFRRVKVPHGIHRGGIVTQASVLSITSNGTRTSPVKRGTWVMKNVLGIDPGLPVANAGDIAPKVPGIDKATVRQRLEIHRSLPQCARCHDKIDPLGFALENFNAAGDWRDQEGFGYKGRIGPNDPKIDASAKMIDGTEFVGVDGLQNVLMKKRHLFLNCLSSKLFTYALGRELGIADQLHVKAAVSHLEKKNDTLRGLLKFIATSEPFLTK